MKKSSTITARRAVIKRVAAPLAALSAWNTPLVQTLVLPAHAQTTDPVCTREDVVGHWQLEILGVAASNSEITLRDDGTAEHLFINAWQFDGDTLQMTQGSTWVLMGQFESCERLSGVYVNIFSIPIVGNVIVRQGDWIATRIL